VSPAAARGRAKRGPGPLQWIALLAAGAVIMALTFTLGVLVGRQWSRPAPITTGPESLARKTVPPGRRGGLSGADVEPLLPVDQKLTFYQTLSAPLGRGAADASQRPEDKGRPQAGAAPARPERAPAPTPSPGRAEGVAAKPAPTESPAAPARPSASPAGLWSVQVAAFKTQAQADALQKQLKRAGFDAYVAAASGSEGQTNYRVRIGTFKSKAEAQRIAEQVRGERSLAAFITPK